ncbi:anti-phage deoxyguanosine triphosphatase [Gallaecimonas kandeliae]|uniref:anti-phage deoxyguanosine triphosphatase n=1 Tax=Gallaecimonas kandeliae TaxID=3029055 RepID=UPI002647CF7B|nr:anti-phage deoxyguanosine triphosphatase [Gallaecimonas kandeliae]WKE66872.1 anti-phage deoxyguanosine triphosphatase [Gallaecimonas kandeliae]
MTTPSTTWSARASDRQQARIEDHRSPFQRDRARILHSAAFRRLQAKTQVLGVGQSDFYRTRLTHSLEAAQIGTGILAQLKIKHPEQQPLLAEDALIDALCLAHDIGHPPFGHGGEVALNYLMRDHGGFEGNAQTLRILAKLEPYTETNGMDLCRRTLLGVLKYPVLQSAASGVLPPLPASARQLKAGDWHPAKALYDEDKDSLDWILAPLGQGDREHFCALQPGKPGQRHGRAGFKSLDCSIMELGDDIAYGIHDMEDAIVLGLVDREAWEGEVASKVRGLELPLDIDALGAQLFSGQHHLRKQAIGTLVNSLITAVRLREMAGFEEPLLAWNAALPEPHHLLLEACKQFVLHQVIQRPELQLLEYKGQQMVMALFEALASDPARLLPAGTRARWQAAGESPRVIADYISGMTDEYASRLYGSLFLPKAGTIFERQPH